jgi:hypothetical protein
MSIRRLASLVAIAAIGVLALGAASASASTALRTDPGGGLLTGSTTITNTTAAPSVLTLTGLGVVTCNQTNFDANVTSNSSAGSITGTLATLTFTTCSDTLPVITISSCTLNPGTTPVVHIFASNDTGGTTTIDDATVRCNIAGSTTSFCYYTAATALGQGNNAASTLTYGSIGVGVVGGSGSLGAACGSTGTFSSTLRHIVQGGTNRTVTVQTT